MMPFDRSFIHVLPYRPFQVATPPTLNQPGVKGTELDGVFILVSPDLVTALKANLTQAEKDELQTWVLQRTEAQCALWNVPVWAGQNSATYLRVPANVWDDPSIAPPLKVRTALQWLWNAAQIEVTDGQGVTLTDENGVPIVEAT